MALPMLPGYSFSDPTKQDFKKTQAFGFKNGLVVNNISKKEVYSESQYEEELPPITLLGPAANTMQRSTRNEPKIDPYVPPDVKYYKQVLQFDAYWKELIGNEQHDRGAVIHYFLEDDTIQVVEPKIPNSGIQQGVLLRRQRIPLETNFANTAPFQTSLNANTTFTRSSPTITRSLPVESGFNKSAKGGVRDPNNYLNSTFNNTSPSRSPTLTRNASPTITRNASPNQRARSSSPINYNTTTTNFSGGKEATSHYTWGDLGVGITVNFLGRDYHIVNADPFTRSFFSDQGIELPDGEELPESLTATKVAPSTRLLSHDTRTAEERYKLRKFLENDRKVLRFYCIWDDKSAGYTERRPFILHYFLVDDTIELRELLGVNSGRDPAATFMKKQRLPKQRTSLSDMKTADHFTDADLAIGNTISVFGRDFLIYDADPYTRRFYEETYGVTEFPKVQVSEQARAIVAREIPEYTGFGSEEDSLANCLSLVPKPPKKAPKNEAYTPSDVMRFTAQMEGGKRGDDERRFVVSYFLEDNTFSVFENPIRGIKGGRFMERKKAKNPKTGAFYQPLDFFVGSVVEANAHKFRLIDADSYACQFLQDNEEEYEQAALDRVVEDVRNATATLKPGLLRRVLTSTPNPSPTTFKQGLFKSGLTLDEKTFSTLLQIFQSAEGVDVSSFLRAMDL